MTMKKDLETTKFASQYKDPRWQKKRLEILGRDGFCCKSCGESGRTLHVHHKIYTYGKMVWDYDDNNLITLCDDCHESIHEEYQSINNAILDFRERVVSLGRLDLLRMIIYAVARIDLDDASKVFDYAYELGEK